MVAILHNETGMVTNWQPFKSEGDAKMALLAYALHARLPHAAIFETIEWVAPFLCLPDLVMNAPKAVIAATRAAGEAGDVAAEADRAGTVLAKTQEKLTGYQQKISDRTLNAGNMAKIQRYRHQINVAARAVDALGDKLAKARTTAMLRAFWSPRPASAFLAPATVLVTWPPPRLAPRLCSILRKSRHCSVA